MGVITKKFYLSLGASEKVLSVINKELFLPVGLKLSPFARPRRIEMLNESIAWPKGKNQKKRKITEIYKSDNFVIAVGKPGKEAAPDFKRKHYITGKTMNNKNDMNPFIMINEKRLVMI